MLNVLECTPIAQFAIGLDHRVTYWNRACELMTGFSAQAMIGSDRQWEPFYPQKWPVLADLIIDDDFRHSKSLYDGKRATKSEIIPNA
ncbi:MAG: PAS domain-containing protein [Thermodesulfobacteriota bacterium]|nr:PAS domain-containing protein [Thermodesulfobacteriota bacterium]